MATAGTSTAASAAAMAAAGGRSDAEPNTYRRPDPMAEPISNVTSRASKVTWVLFAFARLAST